MAALNFRFRRDLNAGIGTSITPGGIASDGTNIYVRQGSGTLAARRIIKVFSLAGVYNSTGDLTATEPPRHGNFGSTTVIGNILGLNYNNGKFFIAYEWRTPGRNFWAYTIERYSSTFTRETTVIVTNDQSGQYNDFAINGTDYYFKDINTVYKVDSNGRGISGFRSINNSNVRGIAATSDRLYLVENDSVKAHNATTGAAVSADDFSLESRLGTVRAASYNDNVYIVGNDTSNSNRWAAWEYGSAVAATASWGTPSYTNQRLRANLRFDQAVSGLEASDFEIVRIDGTVQTGWTFDTIPSTVAANTNVRISVKPPNVTDSSFALRLKATSVRSSGATVDNSPTAAISTIRADVLTVATASLDTATYTNNKLTATLSVGLDVSGLAASDFEIINAAGTVQTGWTFDTPPTTLTSSRTATISANPPDITSGSFRIRLKANSLIPTGFTANSPTTAVTSAAVAINTQAVGTWSNVGYIAGALQGTMTFDKTVSNVLNTDFRVLNASDVEQTGWTFNTPSATGTSFQIRAFPPANTDGSFKLQLKASSVQTTGSTTENAPASAVTSAAVAVNNLDVLIPGINFSIESQFPAVVNINGVTNDGTYLYIRNAHDIKRYTLAGVYDSSYSKTITLPPKPADVITRESRDPSSTFNRGQLFGLGYWDGSFYISYEWTRSNASNQIVQRFYFLERYNTDFEHQESLAGNFIAPTADFDITGVDDFFHNRLTQAYYISGSNLRNVRVEGVSANAAGVGDNLTIAANQIAVAASSERIYVIDSTGVTFYEYKRLTDPEILPELYSRFPDRIGQVIAATFAEPDIYIIATDTNNSDDTTVFVYNDPIIRTGFSNLVWKDDKLQARLRFSQDVSNLANTDLNVIGSPRDSALPNARFNYPQAGWTIDATPTTATANTDIVIKATPPASVTVTEPFSISDNFYAGLFGWRIKKDSVHLTGNTNVTGPRENSDTIDQLGLDHGGTAYVNTYFKGGLSFDSSWDLSSQFASLDDIKGVAHAKGKIYIRGKTIGSSHERNIRRYDPDGTYEPAGDDVIPSPPANDISTDAGGNPVGYTRGDLIGLTFLPPATDLDVNHHNTWWMLQEWNPPEPSSHPRVYTSERYTEFFVHNVQSGFASFQSRVDGHLRDSILDCDWKIRTDYDDVNDSPDRAFYVTVRQRPTEIAGERYLVRVYTAVTDGASTWLTKPTGEPHPAWCGQNIPTWNIWDVRGPNIAASSISTLYNSGNDFITTYNVRGREFAQDETRSVEGDYSNLGKMTIIDGALYATAITSTGLSMIKLTGVPVRSDVKLTTATWSNLQWVPGRWEGRVRGNAQHYVENFRRGYILALLTFNEPTTELRGWDIRFGPRDNRGSNKWFGSDFNGAIIEPVSRTEVYGLWGFEFQNLPAESDALSNSLKYYWVKAYPPIQSTGPSDMKVRLLADGTLGKYSDYSNSPAMAVTSPSITADTRPSGDPRFEWRNIRWDGRRLRGVLRWHDAAIYGISGRTNIRASTIQVIDNATGQVNPFWQWENEPRQNQVELNLQRTPNHEGIGEIGVVLRPAVTTVGNFSLRLRANSVIIDRLQGTNNPTGPPTNVDSGTVTAVDNRSALIATATWSNQMWTGTKLTADLTFNFDITGLGVSDLYVTDATNVAASGWNITIPPSTAEGGVPVTIEATPPSVRTRGSFKLALRKASVIGPRSGNENSPQFAGPALFTDAIEVQDPVVAGATWGTPTYTAGGKLTAAITFGEPVDGVAATDFAVTDASDAVVTDWIIDTPPTSIAQSVATTITALPPANTDGDFKLRLKAGSVNGPFAVDNSPAANVNSTAVSVDNTSIVYNASFDTWVDSDTIEDQSSINLNLDYDPGTTLTVDDIEVIDTTTGNASGDWTITMDTVGVSRSITALPALTVPRGTYRLILKAGTFSTLEPIADVNSPDRQVLYRVRWSDVDYASSSITARLTFYRLSVTDIAASDFEIRDRDDNELTDWNITVPATANDGVAISFLATSRSGGLATGIRVRIILKAGSVNYTDIDGIETAPNIDIVSTEVEGTSHPGVFWSDVTSGPDRQRLYGTLNFQSDPGAIIRNAEIRVQSKEWNSPTWTNEYILDPGNPGNMLTLKILGTQGNKRRLVVFPNNQNDLLANPPDGLYRFVFFASSDNASFYSAEQPINSWWIQPRTIWSNAQYYDGKLQAFLNYHQFTYVSGVTTDDFEVVNVNGVPQGGWTFDSIVDDPDKLGIWIRVTPPTQTNGLYSIRIKDQVTRFDYTYNVTIEGIATSYSKQHQSMTTDTVMVNNTTAEDVSFPFLRSTESPFKPPAINHPYIYLAYNIDDQQKVLMLNRNEIITFNTAMTAVDGDPIRLGDKLFTGITTFGVNYWTVDSITQEHDMETYDANTIGVPDDIQLAFMEGRNIIREYRYGSVRTFNEFGFDINNAFVEEDGGYSVGGLLGTWNSLSAFGQRFPVGIAYLDQLQSFVSVGWGRADTLDRDRIPYYRFIGRRVDASTGRIFDPGQIVSSRDGIVYREPRFYLFTPPQSSEVTLVTQTKIDRVVNQVLDIAGFDRGIALLEEDSREVKVYTNNFQYSESLTFPLHEDNSKPLAITWAGSAFVVYDANGNFYRYGDPAADVIEREQQPDETITPPTTPGVVPTALPVRRGKQYRSSLYEFEDVFDVYRTLGNTFEVVGVGIHAITETDASRVDIAAASDIPIETQQRIIAVYPRYTQPGIVPGDYLLPHSPSVSLNQQLTTLPGTDRLSVTSVQDTGNQAQVIICEVEV